MDTFTRVVNNAMDRVAEAFKQVAERIAEAYEALANHNEGAGDKHAPPAYVALTRPRPHRVHVQDKVIDRRPVVSHRLNH